MIYDDDEQDLQPTWEEVGRAYDDGLRLGMLIGAAQYKEKRRKKLIEVGYYICLRDLNEHRSKTNE